MRAAVLTFLFIAITTVYGYAQRKTVVNQFQFWGGYMTSTALNQRWSWWNDAHAVTNGGFWIIRTGLTYNLPQTAFTAGYAYLRLPLGGGNETLGRPEHRPWAQLVFNQKLDHHFSLTSRIRYDARFRHRVMNGELTDGYNFNHRVRFQFNMRKALPAWNFNGHEPFVALANEVLVNFGKEIVNNHFDQNRISLMIGLKKKNVQFMTGYMDRFVQGSGNQFTRNHTWVIWVIQKFPLRKQKRHFEEMDTQSADE
jgi:hypothetical protein